MPMPRVRIRHPLLDRLRELDEEAARRFPDRFDLGLGRLGLILDKQLDRSRYDGCTPRNCRTFANTGGREFISASWSARAGSVRTLRPS